MGIGLAFFQKIMRIETTYNKQTMTSTTIQLRFLVWRSVGFPTQERWTYLGGSSNISLHLHTTRLASLSHFLDACQPNQRLGTNAANTSWAQRRFSWSFWTVHLQDRWEKFPIYATKGVAWNFVGDLLLANRKTYNPNLTGKDLDSLYWNFNPLCFPQVR